MSVSLLLKAQNPIVSTTNGKVQGSNSSDNTVRIFKGIPFTAPPVGDLRWKAPQAAVQNWKGIKECKSFSASPVQNRSQPFYCWTEEFIAQTELMKESGYQSSGNYGFWDQITALIA